MQTTEFNKFLLVLRTYLVCSIHQIITNVGFSGSCVNTDECCIYLIYHSVQGFYTLPYTEQCLVNVVEKYGLNLLLMELKQLCTYPLLWEAWLVDGSS